LGFNRRREMNSVLPITPIRSREGHTKTDGKVNWRCCFSGFQVQHGLSF
jgi:hypothetical protein